MTPWAIVDTGPLVAFLDRRERHHAWAVEQMRGLHAPLLVCEPVLTEAMFLLSHFPTGRDTLLQWLERGAMEIGLHLDDHTQSVRALLAKYQDVPMSLADACLVRWRRFMTGMPSAPWIPTSPFIENTVAQRSR